MKMLKKSACLGVWLSVMTLAAAEASSSNVGWSPQQGHLRLGGFLHPVALDVDEYDNRIRVKDSDLDYEGLEIQYGLTEALHMSIRYGLVSWRPDSEAPERFDNGIAWGIGLGGTVPVRRADHAGIDCDLGWAIAYDRGQPDAVTRLDGAVFDAELEWWHADLLLAGGYDQFYGFAGLRYTQMDLTYTHDSSRGRRRGGFQEADPWGGVVGGGIVWQNGVVLQGEVPLGNIDGYKLALMVDIGLPEGWFK